MNAEVFAEWLKRQGHRVVRTPSSYWYDAGPRILQSFPYHWIVDPGEDEIGQLFRDNKVFGLRYSAPERTCLGRVSYHGVTSAPYGRDRLSANSRSCVNRGLRHCQVERISFRQLAEAGWKLQRDTQDRQHRSGSVNEEQWRGLCVAAETLKGFEAWGALVAGDLAASILVAVLDDTAYYLYPQSDRSYFKMHVNNALVYNLTTEMLGRPGIKTVFYGLESLDAPPSVDEFKFRMGYEPKPVRQRIVFHPWIGPFCNRFSHSLLKIVHRSYIGGVALAKAEGLLRFYLEKSDPAVMRECEGEAMPAKRRY